MVIIGSTALKQYGLVERPPSDTDVVIHYSEFTKLVEYLKSTDNIKFIRPINNRRVRMGLNTSSHQYDVSFDVLESEKMLLAASTDWETIKLREFGDFEVKLPPLEWLYLIKTAHIYCDTNGFDKNIVDYAVMKGELTISNRLVFTDEMINFKRIRRQEAEIFHKHRTPKLNVSNDEFFEVSSKTVGYDFVHDDLHEVYKHRDVPIYQMMKTDQSKAKCEAELFNELPHDLKVESVLEEAYVIATERYLLKRDISQQDAFLMALRRICTTLCSGFFRAFAVDNYFEITTKSSTRFATKFIHAYNENRIGLLRSESEVLDSIKLLRRNIAEN